MKKRPCKFLQGFLCSIFSTLPVHIPCHLEQVEGFLAMQDVLIAIPVLDCARTDTIVRDVQCHPERSRRVSR